ncbi:hypothetical protein C8Q76DRAFT_823920, partial [Earliella scabrosa]
AVHSGANIAGLKTNQSAVVFGMGAVSLPPGARSEPRACGVIAVDIVLSRVEFAEAYAAMDTYVPPKFQRNAKLKMQQLGLEERGPTAIDLIVEASGAEVFIQTSILLLCSGTLRSRSVSTQYKRSPASRLPNKPIANLVSPTRQPGGYNLAIALVVQGKVDLKPLVTHRFNEAVKAFQAMRASKSEDGKPVIMVVIFGPHASSDDLL